MKLHFVADGTGTILAAVRRFDSFDMINPQIEVSLRTDDKSFEADIPHELHRGNLRLMAEAWQFDHVKSQIHLKK